MRPLAFLTAPVLVLVAAVPASAARFDLGVSASEVGPRSAILWTHATDAGPLELQLATNKRFTKNRREFNARARAGDDLTAQKKVGRLKPGTKYFFRFLSGKRKSPRGTFVTAPAPKADATISFAWSGDADAQPLPGQTAPFWNNFEVYRAMAAERNHFNINLGDIIYSDTEVEQNDQPVAPTALSVADKWAKYRQNLRLANLQRLRRTAGLYSHWDDHEFVNDFSVSENGREVYDAGVQAFRDYNPVTYSGARGIYRSFRWGRNLELFFLDERSFRSAKVSSTPACNNPATGGPDLAPTAPPGTRFVFQALVPSLAQPVSPECTAAINDPNRTMLGTAQRGRFLAAVQRSTARFKVIVNEVPIQQFYALPYDRWEGYEAERVKVVETLREKVKNAIFLTTDVHANLVNTIKFDTLGSNPRDSGIFDVTTGPVGTATFRTEIEGVTGPGSGPAVDSFLDGFMRCAELDTYSYGQVEVNSRELTVRLKDSAGRPLVNKSQNEPCEPVVIEAD